MPNIVKNSTVGLSHGPCKKSKKRGNSTSNRVLPNPCFNLNRQEKARRRFDNRVFGPTPIFELVSSCEVD